MIVLPPKMLSSDRLLVLLRLIMLDFLSTALGGGKSKNYILYNPLHTFYELIYKYLKPFRTCHKKFYQLSEWHRIET